MVPEWPIKTIGECAAQEPYATQIGPFGKALTSDSYLSHGVPVLRGVNVNRGRFHDDDFVFISEDDADRLSKFESFPGDVLLVHKGTLGEIGLMPYRRRFDRYIMGNSMMRVRCDPQQLLPEYLYYWLSSPEGYSYLMSRVSQVGVPQIQRPLTTLREAAFPVPPVPEQKAILRLLVPLDDKIVLNRRMNRTLEAMARATFKAWFVDFEPIRAKTFGAHGYTGMPPAVYNQLPSRFLESELGEIPDGWGVEPLSGLAELLGGGTPKRNAPEYWTGDIPWFSVRDAPSETDAWVIDTAEHITQAGVANSSTRIMRAGTTIISARGTVGRLAITAVPMAMNQSCYGLQGKEGVGDAFVYFTMKDAVSQLRQHSHGSVFDTITRDTFDRLNRVRPQVEVLAAFEGAVLPYLELIRANVFESRTLASMRDALLPRLISGAVRVSPPEGADDGH